MHKRQHGVLLFALLLAAGCRTGQDYLNLDGPRFSGSPSVARVNEPAVVDTLRLVSFNIEFALRVDSAIAVISSTPALRDADVILLQEMDEKATQRVSEVLGLWYVYYPAIFHLRTRRNFGNAVLSRWPIVEDSKILLPHVSRFARTHRAATAATIRVGSALIRVYSTHLGTPVDVGAGSRRDQLRAILADAERYSRVVIGGDMNDGSVGRVAREMGYAWPTERGPRTTSLGRWDHIFLKGLLSPDSAAAGTVLDVRGTSDHRPVWAAGILR
ncbi:MAG: endonuclease/exonuclease/phosphatase family protein [Anaerolineae bacterium]|nr:endonuclease/exonuclease/phosphatase family protein [Gemmatimonadaceae bacterium]